jgi:hypothetical protein
MCGGTACHAMPCLPSHSPTGRSNKLHIPCTAHAAAEAAESEAARLRFVREDGKE